jgi:hypothetical protein
MRIVIRTFLVFLISFLAVALFGFSAPTIPIHYMVFEIDDQGVVTLESSSDVEIVGPIVSASLEGSALDLPVQDGTGMGRDSIVATVLDDQGEPRFRTIVEIDRALRAEFADEKGQTHGQWFKPSRTAFVVRVPKGLGDAVEIANPATRKSMRVPIGVTGRRLVSTTAGLSFRPVVNDISNGSPANRLDILIVSEGYTASQQSKFNTDAAVLANQFFSATPYSEYRNYANVTTLFVASAQAGADHPVCSDPTKVPDPLEGTLVNTAFDGAYCSFGVQRNVGINTTKVLTAAAAAPDHDKIIVLVNDSFYGGSGGPISVVSTHTDSVLIAQHEFGHSFSRLTDEYTTAVPDFPACSDITGPACEPNATDRTDRPTIKWNAWIDLLTPIPTSSTDTVHVGLFQGARYSPTTYYRSKSRCRMNELADPFCEICRQTFVLTLYRGGWGVPGCGVDLIEPGTASPPSEPSGCGPQFPNCPVVTGALGQPSTFGVTLLNPVGGGPVTTQWSVNGTPVGGANGTNFTYTPTSSGQVSIVVTASDSTPFVNASMAGTSLQKTRCWTLNTPCVSPTITSQPQTVSVPAGTGVTLSVGANGTSLNYQWFIGTSGVTTTPIGGATSASVNVAPSSTTTYWVRVSNSCGTVDSASATVTVQAIAAANFFLLSPCRVLDTRGGPPVPANGVMNLVVTGKCGVAAGATGLAINVTVLSPAVDGLVVLYPGPANTVKPIVSTINYTAGRTLANNARITVGVDGSINIFNAAGTPLDFLIDLSGYFK